MTQYSDRLKNYRFDSSLIQAPQKTKLHSSPSPSTGSPSLNLAKRSASVNCDYF